MHTRAGHYKAIFGPWWAVLNGLWTLLSSADTLVGKYGSDDFKKTWDAAWITPKWGWKVWAIGVSVSTAIFAIEYSFRHIKKHEMEGAAREESLRRDIDAEKIRKQKPII